MQNKDGVCVKEKSASGKFFRNVDKTRVVWNVGITCMVSDGGNTWFGTLAMHVRSGTLAKHVWLGTLANHMSLRNVGKKCVVRDVGESHMAGNVGKTRVVRDIGKYRELILLALSSHIFACSWFCFWNVFLYFQP